MAASGRVPALLALAVVLLLAAGALSGVQARIGRAALLVAMGAVVALIAAARPNCAPSAARGLASRRPR